MLSPTDALTYVTVEGERRTVSPLAKQLAALAPGLVDVRDADPKSPRSHAAFVKLGPEIFAVGLGAITPEKGDDPRIDRPRGVLVLGKRISPQLLSQLGRDFGIEDLLLAGSAAADPKTHVALNDFGNVEIGAVRWRPPTPGTDWIRIAVPGLLILIAIVAGFALQVFGVWGEALDRLFAKEMMLRAARDEAEAADRAKSVFLANVSHELRTPLNAIIGFSSIMSDQMLGPIGSSKYHGYAKDIQSTSRHLMAIINEILDLSNIESARHGLDVSSFPPADAIGEALRLAHAEFPHVRIESPGSPRSNLLVRADRAKFIQILANLIANAARASGAGGRVSIREQCDSHGGYAIEVADSGAAIDESKAKILFTPFARSGNMQNLVGSSYGIGLAVSKRLAELHGATLVLRANGDARGSTAVLTFPSGRVITSTDAEVAAG